MSVKMRSRREFLGTAGVPLSAGLLAGSAKRMRAESGSSQAARTLRCQSKWQNGASPVRVKEAVLFPFDDHSIPMIWGLKLDLIMGKNPGAINPVVLAARPAGHPDSESVRYYGTVIQVGNELRMWYLGRGDKRKGGLLLLYAVSKDGVHWEKPRLGLVEYNGNKQNNAVQLLEDKYSLGESVVIYDPDDTEARTISAFPLCSPQNGPWAHEGRSMPGEPFGHRHPRDPQLQTGDWSSSDTQRSSSSSLERCGAVETGRGSRARACATVR